jgi:hypothetical protein
VKVSDKFLNPNHLEKCYSELGIILNHHADILHAPPHSSTSTSRLLAVIEALRLFHPPKLCLALLQNHSVGIYTQNPFGPTEGGKIHVENTFYLSFAL